MKPASPLARAGFTLVEMLAVLAILALVATMVTPLVTPPRGALILETSAHRLCSMLRAARARAIATNRQTSVEIDVDHRLVGAGDRDEIQLPATTKIELTFADDRRRDASSGGVRFYPSGSSSGAEITLTDGSKRAKIVVGWLTGEASCAY
jgi:general secretion pathway protein H